MNDICFSDFISHEEHKRSRENDFVSAAHKRVRKPKEFWSPEEDSMLRQEVLKYSTIILVCWSDVATHFPSRCAKQCRERYMEHISPDIDHSEFDEEEDRIILSVQKEIGNRWKDICKKLQPYKYRSPTSVKVRFHQLQRRIAHFQKLEQQSSVLMMGQERMLNGRSDSLSSEHSDAVFSHEQPSSRLIMRPEFNTRSDSMSSDHSAATTEANHSSSDEAVSTIGDAMDENYLLPMSDDELDLILDAVIADDTFWYVNQPPQYMF